MIFRKKEADWNNDILKMIKSIKKGWDIPPLLIWYLNRELSIADGAHRSVALHKAGHTKYWIFIWFENDTEYEHFQKAQNHNISNN